MKKFIPFLMLFLLFGCSQGANETLDGTADISEKINEYLGITPYLPETDYEIGTVLIEYSPKMEGGVATKGEPFTATIEYKVSLDEKVDEEFKDAWVEERPFTEIIYGDLYMDRAAIMVTVAPGGIGELMDADLVEIDGHEVQYQYIQREEDTVFIFINFDDIGYQIQYQAEKDDMEEEAKAFAKEIINNN